MRFKFSEVNDVLNVEATFMFQLNDDVLDVFFSSIWLIHRLQSYIYFVMCRIPVVWEIRTIYNQVCDHLANGTGDLMFVQGKAGVGKTTLNRVLLA